MPRPSVACTYPGPQHLPMAARVANRVVPWGRSLAVRVIGQAEGGAMGCELACAIIHRLRYAED